MSISKWLVYPKLPCLSASGLALFLPRTFEFARGACHGCGPPQGPPTSPPRCMRERSTATKTLSVSIGFWSLWPKSRSPQVFVFTIGILVLSDEVIWLLFATLDCRAHCLAMAAVVSAFVAASVCSCGCGQGPWLWLWLPLPILVASAAQHQFVKAAQQLWIFAIVSYKFC